MPKRINKVPIMDATRRAIINIKPLDVKRGKTGNPGKCAAARACLHDLGAKAARVHVGRTYVELPAQAARKFGVKPKEGDDKVWVRFRTPPALRTEVVTFDRGAKFQTGEYVLPPLQKSHRATGRRIGGMTAKRRRVNGVKPKRRPHPRHVTTGVRTFNRDELMAA